MLNKIAIKKFKKIQSEGWLTLDNLARVNYLVGENWSGKSSIIASLYGIGKYFDDDSEVILLFADWSSRINSIKNGIQSFSKFIDYKSYFHDNSDLDHHWWYSEKIIIEDRIENNIWHVGCTPKMKINVTWDIYKNIDVIKTVEDFTQKEWIFLLPEIAWWHKFLYSLFDIFEKFGISSWHKIFLFEEPEFWLHPSFQKLLPSIFNYLIRDNSEFQFFITTHSPFVISAAGECDDQRVYLIENWQTKDILWAFNTEESKNWYSWWAALMTANIMLWSWLSDFIPSKIIFCENSLMVLLKGHCQKFSLAMPCFFYTNWDSVTISKVDIFNKICLLLSKPNDIIFGKNVIWVVDKLSDSDKSGNYNEIKNIIIIIKDKDGNDTEELEQLYPKELVNNFIKEEFENYKYLLADERFLPSDRTDWKFKDHFLGILKDQVKKAKHKDAVLWILKEKLAIYIIEKTDKKEDICSRFSNIDNIL